MPGAFAAAPDAHAWAERYARDVVVSDRTYRRQTAPHTVAYAVEGLAVACVDDVPDRLVRLLRETVADVAARRTGPCGHGAWTPDPLTSRVALRRQRDLHPQRVVVGRV